MAQTSLYGHLTMVAAKQEEVDHTSLMRLLYQQTTTTTTKDTLQHAANTGPQWRQGCSSSDASSSVAIDLRQKRLNCIISDNQIGVSAVIHEQMLEREQAPTLSGSPCMTSTMHKRQQQQKQKQRNDCDAAAAVDQDRALAKCLQREWQSQARRDQRAREIALRDQYLAESLQRQWHAELARSMELREMARANYGRAGKFVRELCKLHETWTQRANSPTISFHTQVVAARNNGLVDRVQQVMDHKDAFRVAGKPSWVDIGYHYTTRTNMSGIEQAGLLTKAERRARNIQTNDNGSRMGDGIYTGNNPYDYHGRFGNVGLLVLRLKGQTHRLDESGTAAVAAVGEKIIAAADTLVSGTRNQRVVLRRSMQCAAIVSFHWSLIRPGQPNFFGNQFIESYCRELQGLVNEFFNL